MYIGLLAYVSLYIHNTTHRTPLLGTYCFVAFFTAFLEPARRLTALYTVIQLLSLVLQIVGAILTHHKAVMILYWMQMYFQIILLGGEAIRYWTRTLLASNEGTDVYDAHEVPGFICGAAAVLSAHSALPMTPHNIVETAFQHAIAQWAVCIFGFGINYKIYFGLINRIRQFIRGPHNEIPPVDEEISRAKDGGKTESIEGGGEMGEIEEARWDTNRRKNGGTSWKDHSGKRDIPLY